MPMSPKPFRLHAPIKRDERRYASRQPENQSLYNNERWRGSKRTVGIKKMRFNADPLCVVCEKAGRLTVATDVDHIVPHKGDPAKFFDYDNTQSLCHPCHSRKTAKEDGGFGNRIAGGAKP